MGEHKSLDVDWKAGTEPGTLEGYASIFGNVDHEGDVVMPGAFKRTVDHWNRSSQPMPLLADHEASTSGVIGSIVSLREDARGLKFKARFSSTPKAQDVRTNMLEGHVKGMSYGYLPIKARRANAQDKNAFPSARRFLEEIRLFELTVTPFPMNDLTDALAKAVVDRPWDGSPSRFTDEQYQRSCLIDRGGDAPVKQRCSLPIREPNGDINKNALGAAAAVLAGGRGGLSGVSPAQKASAARALIRAYGEADMEPPESLRRAAGSTASLDPEWESSMRAALEIPHEGARKAAVDQLVAVYAPPENDSATVEGDEPEDTVDDSVTDDGDTSDDASGDYPLAFLASSSKGEGDGNPPPALPEPLAGLDRDRSATEIDSLESELARDLAQGL